MILLATLLLALSVSSLLALHSHKQDILEKLTGVARKQRVSSPSISRTAW